MSKEEKLNEKYPFQVYTFSNISMLEQNGFNFDDYSFNLQHEHELYIGNINGLICRHDMGYPLRMLKYLKQDPDTMVKRKLTFLLPENYKENIGNLKGLRENVIKVFDLPCFNDQINILTYKVDNSNIMEKIEELKNMPKFDIIIANPPYGEPSTGDLQLHYTITSMLLNKYKSKMIVIMPHRIAYSTSNKYDKFKKLFTNVSSVVEVDSKCFINTSMPNVGIFVFENEEQNNILIKLKNKEYNVNSWFDIKPFNEYETLFISKLYNKNPNYNAYRPIGKDKDVNGKLFFDNYCNKHKFNNNDIFVISCLANGAGMGKGIFISSKDTQLIFNNLIDLKTYFIQHNNFGKVISKFKNIVSATNYLNALKRPLLRFTLCKMQDDQSMTKRCYQYIPDIDWSDNKTLTDDGILELCGFSNNDAIEFSTYCKEYIEKLDNQK